MSNNVITPEDKREVLNKVTVGKLTVTEEGKINGYIPVGIREDINFDELMEEADVVEGTASISFKKTKNQDEA